MRPRNGLLALAALFLLAAAPTEQQITAEKEKMVGTYKLYGLEINGQEIEPEQIRRFECTVTRDTIAIKANTQERANTYRIDPTKDPKTIDLIWKGQVTLGIYYLNGDKFKLCLAPEGSRKRPTDFEGKKGSNWKSFNMHREKR